MKKLPFLLMLLLLPIMLYAQSGSLHISAPEHAQPGESVRFTITAELGGIPILSVPLKTEIITPHQETIPVQLNNSLTGYWESSFIPKDRGVYTIRATSEIKGETIIKTHSIRVGIEAAPPEPEEQTDDIVYVFHQNRSLITSINLTGINKTESTTVFTFAESITPHPFSIFTLNITLDQASEETAEITLLDSENKTIWTAIQYINTTNISISIRPSDLPRGKITATINATASHAQLTQTLPYILSLKDISIESANSTLVIAGQKTTHIFNAETLPMPLQGLVYRMGEIEIASDNSAGYTSIDFNAPEKPGRYLINITFTDTENNTYAYLRRIDIQASEHIPILSSPRNIVMKPGEPFSLSYTLNNPDPSSTEIFDIEISTDLSRIQIYLDTGKGLSPAQDNNLNSIPDTGILLPATSSELIITGIVPNITGEYVFELLITARSPKSGRNITLEDTITVIQNEIIIEETINDLAIYKIGKDGDLIQIHAYNNDIIVKTFDIHITIEHQSSGSTISLIIPDATIESKKEGIFTIQSPIPLEDTVVTASVETGDNKPENDYRTMYFKQKWIHEYESRIAVPISERFNKFHDEYIIRVNIHEDIDFRSIAILAPSYDGSWQMEETSFSIPSTDPSDRYILFKVHNIPANFESTAYIYYTIRKYKEIESQEWDSGLIFDNTDETTTLSGRWFEDYQVPGYHGNDYIHDLNFDKGKKSVTYSPSLRPSLYEVYINSPKDKSFSSRTPVTIAHSHGRETVFINQKIISGWHYIGMYELDEGSTIRISNAGTDDLVIADAILVNKITQYTSLSKGESLDEFIARFKPFNLSLFEQENKTLNETSDIVANASHNLTDSPPLNITTPENDTIHPHIYTYLSFIVTKNQTLYLEIANLFSNYSISHTYLIEIEDDSETSAFLTYDDTDIQYEDNITITNTTITITTGYIISPENITLTMSDCTNERCVELEKTIISLFPIDTILNMTLNMTANITTNITANMTTNISSTNETENIIQEQLQQIFNFPEIKLEKNSTTTLNLSLYFLAPDHIRYELFHTETENVSGLTLSIEGDILTAQSSEAASGNLSTFLFITSINKSIISNPLHITIIEETTAPPETHHEPTIIQHEAKVGEPVSWTVIPSGTETDIPPDSENLEAEDAVIIIGTTSIPIETFNRIKEKDVLSRELEEIESNKKGSGLFRRAALAIESSRIEKKISDIETETEDITIDKSQRHILQSAKEGSSIRYQTPAPQKREKEIGTGQISKQVIIYSEASMHYTDVRAETTIKEGAIVPRIFHIIDGKRVDVTNDPRYDVIYLDTDGNGIPDIIQWVVPQLSEQVFEIGIATINTLKSIYRPGETADVVIAVLDIFGYLVSGADVSATITSPDNTTAQYTTGSETITETSKGIYTFSHVTSLEGIYGMDVHAKETNVDSSMSSSFETRTDYPFDILRDIPAATDPWKGPFTSQITIVAHTDASVFSFTEKVPIDFIVSDYGHASVIQEGEYNHLTWHNLNNNSQVSYNALPPLKTPRLYAIGPSIVTYNLMSFTEARPWYLAVDPIEQSTHYCVGITTAGNQAGDDTGTCAQVNATDGIRPAGGDNALEWYWVNGAADIAAIVDVTFDSTSNAQTEVINAMVSMYWWVEDVAGTCDIEVNNGTGFEIIDTTCYAAAGLRSYNVSNYIHTGDAANGFRFRITYNGVRNAGDRTDELYVDSIFLFLNTTAPPNYDIWGINVSNGATVRRGNAVLAYAHWNYTDGISEAYIEHNGDGTYKNYTISSPFPGDWTNHTLETSNTTIFNRTGRVDVRAIYAKDVDGFRRTAPAKWFFLYDYSNISETTLLPSTVNQSQGTLFSCKVINDELNRSISDYTVQFSVNGIWKTSNKTDPTGWARYHTSFPNPASYNITCSIANSGYYFAKPGAESATRNLTVLDSTPPVITLGRPQNTTQQVNNKIAFTFNVTDIWSGISSCSLMINGTLNKTITDVSKISTNNFTEDFGQGSWNWRINCTDNSTNRNMRTSPTRIFTITEDIIPPEIYLVAPPNAADTSENVTFRFYAIDALSDLGACQLHIDGVANQTTYTVSNGEEITLTVTDLDIGLHSWRVNCTDNSSNRNYQYSSSWTFSVGDDETPPDIDIITPTNNTIDTDGQVLITYTATDYLSGIPNCSLYLNGALNQVNTTINESGLNHFSLSGLAAGNYWIQINCTDDSTKQNEGRSQKINFSTSIDLDGPVITLISPSPMFHSVSGNLIFIYNVTDKSAIANCSLLLNGSITATNHTVQKSQNQRFEQTGLSNGFYNWSVLCTDLSDSQNTSISETWNFTVGPDLLPPIITLYAPINNSIDTDGVITFTYEVLDETSGIESCTVYVDGSAADTDTAVQESTLQSLSTTLPDGSYTWYINCTDSSPQQNEQMSEVRWLNVSITFETDYSITMESNYAAAGQLIYPIGNFKDSASINIPSASAYAYIVRNIGAYNHTLPWLDSSFTRRVEIEYSNNEKEAFESSPIIINLSTQALISAGMLNANCSDLRFGDQGNNLLPHYFFDADNGCGTANTRILVLAERLWGDTTHQIGTYFNSASANSDTTSRTAFPVVDNFDSGDTFTSGYWTTDYSAVADEWALSAASSSDGSNSAGSTIACDNQCRNSGGRASSFSKSINVPANSTLTWRWRVTNANARVRFFLDGTLMSSTTNTAWNTGSQVITPGSHTIRWEFFHSTQATYSGYVDQVYLYTHNSVQGTTSSIGEYVSTLTPTTTDTNGNAFFSWDSAEQSYGNYSVTGYGSSGSYWQDNGWFFFTLGPDLESPYYSRWGLNVTDGSIVYRGQQVLAYSYWHDRVNISLGMIEHSGQGSYHNYSIAPISMKRESWANYTLNTTDTTEFTSLGRVNVSTIYLNDTSGNSNKTAPPKYFLLYSKAEINSSTISSSVVIETTNFTMSCQVRDEFDNQSIPGYLVSFYFQGILKGTSLTDPSGWADLSMNATTAGENRVARCEIANQTSSSYTIGNPYYAIEYLNVTDNTPPTVSLFRPENNSVKNSATQSFGFTVFDTGSLDSCMLYGDFSGSWHLNQTLNTPSNGDLNYFSPIDLTQGTYNWYVACNDTENNIGYSKNWTFNISLQPPAITLLYPSNNALLSPGDKTFNFSVNHGDPSVSIINCSLFINNTMVWSTNDTIPKNSQRNITGITLSYGTYQWRVTCLANNTLSSSAQRNSFILEIQRATPTDGASFSRDGTMGYPSTILFSADEISGASGTSIAFIANITSPGIVSGQNLTIGTNQTNSSGTAHFSYPVDQLLPGNYSWWARFTNWPLNKTDNGFFHQYGSIGTRFNSTFLDPNPLYRYQENITINASVYSSGTETASQLISSYGLTINATLLSPSGTKDQNITIVHDGSIWTTTLNTSSLFDHGTWKINLTSRTTSQFLLVNETQSRTFYLNLTGFGIPKITLNHPAPEAVIVGAFINFNWTVEDSIETSVICNLSVNGTAGAINIPSISGISTNYSLPLSEGAYLWNVSCRDTAGNMNTSATYNFTLIAPNVNLAIADQTDQGIIALVYAPINFSANYTNNLGKGISTGSCAISFNDTHGGFPLAWNTTGKDIFTFSRSFNKSGTYTWNVTCTDLILDTASQLSQIIINRTSVWLNAPSEGRDIDRDGTSATMNQSIGFRAHLNHAPNGTEISFFADMTGPDPTRRYFIGMNLTNTSGHAIFLYNPNNTVYAGNYTFYANSTDADPANSSFHHLFGSLLISFSYPFMHPNTSYEHNSSISIHVNISSLGPEAGDLLNSSYGFDDSAVCSMESPSQTDTRNSTMQYSQVNLWNCSLFINTTSEKGSWNATASINASYFLPTSVYGRAVNITRFLTSLDIWNQFSIMEGWIPAYRGENISFYANYTHHGRWINPSVCNFSFPGAWDFGTSHPGRLLQEYTNMSFSSAGLFSWNVSCSAADYEPQSRTDQVRIYPKTHTFVEKTITSIGADLLNISLTLLNNATYPDFVSIYDFVRHGFHQWGHDYSPNQTLEIDIGIYTGNATQYDLTITGENNITYLINASDNWKYAWLYIIGN